MTMFSTVLERPTCHDIDTGAAVWAVAFSASGKYLMSGGGTETIQVWRLQDGARMTSIKLNDVICLTVSKDGRWTAAGTLDGAVVWRRGKIFKQKGSNAIHAVDFSPDSTQVVLASSKGTATVWALGAVLRQVLTLHRSGPLRAAKYSPQGDRIATATRRSIRIYDSKNGHFLVDIKVNTTPCYNTGILWSNNHLFVISGSMVKEFSASTGSALSEWTVPRSDISSCIALSQQGNFIAYSSDRTVTLWETSMHTQLGLINHPQYIYWIALSPDSRFLAVGGERGKIRIECLSRIIEPDIHIGDDALRFWKQGLLANLDTWLTARISNSRDASQYLLAIRALVRGRAKQWNAALADAEKSIKIQPSILGYIAKSISLVGKGDRHKGYRFCDFASERFYSQSSHGFFLLAKAIIKFMAGEQRDAISRMNDLINTVPFNSICYGVQAYMLLHRGNSLMDSNDYNGAIQAFESATSRMQNYGRQLPLVISLMTGWNFDDLDIAIRQHLCEALYAKGCKKEARNHLLEMVNISGEKVYASESSTRWVSHFTHRCLSTGNEDTADVSIVSAIPLLREWAKATLVDGEWRDAIFAAAKFTLWRVTIYRAVCERLEAIARIADAVDCFNEMMTQVGGEIYINEPMTEWVGDFAQRRLSVGSDGDVVSIKTKPPSLDDSPTPLLREWVKAKLMSVGWKDALATTSDFRFTKVAVYQVICEHLEASKRLSDSIECFDQMINEFGNEYATGPATEWAHDFIQRRLSAIEHDADGQVPDANQDTIISTRARFLVLWVEARLSHGSWKEAMLSAAGFSVSKWTIYRALCEHLEKIDNVADAITCSYEMTDELARETDQLEHAQWAIHFRQRSFQKLEHLGDVALDAQNHAVAISLYTTSLSLRHPFPQDILIKRSKAYLATKSWKEAEDDAIKLIELDPCSPWGYEIKYAALQKAGDYDSAVTALETMLSKMVESADPDVQLLHDQYISPCSTRAAIRKSVQRTLRRLPRILINTATGRLHERTHLASAFESTSIFNELISSMTMRIDYGRIKDEVRQYFQYVMFSHRWEDNEPLFQQVVHMSVYDLDKSPTHDKLQTFCKIVRDAGFNWAWSDTCCINKSDHFFLQEALVAMFKWYEGAALTIVFLRGVRSSSMRGALARSIWNTRAWTLQEYVASETIHFYTEEWTPYRNLQLPNHKDSPEVISEMEAATGVSAQQLRALRPGLSSIREKLRLASSRRTTLVEDTAYSLLGIFSASGISAIYGEGRASLGRLLAHILSGSGDASVLAWTGVSGSYNSCLPANISVFGMPATSHLPIRISAVEMEHNIAASSSSADTDIALKLYDCLNNLPAPWFAAVRMKLPCIAFPLPPLSEITRTRTHRIYRTHSHAFGVVELKTRQDLSHLRSLHLVHPWLDALLGRENMRSSVAMDDDFTIALSFSEPYTDDEEMADEDVDDPSSESVTPEPLPIPAPVRFVPVDKEMHARRLVVRLRQQFGALLLALKGRRGTEYGRVAADAMISVRIQEHVSLDDILNHVRTFDVL